MGFIYFIALNDQYIKIGYSKLPYRRFFEIKAYNPNNISLIGLMEGSIADERRLHRLFESQRVRNEWFLYNEKMEDFISTYCEPPDFDDLDENQWFSLDMKPFREKLGQWISLVQEKKKSIILNKWRRPAVAIVPLEDLNFLLEHGQLDMLSS